MAAKGVLLHTALSNLYERITEVQQRSREQRCHYISLDFGPQSLQVYTFVHAMGLWQVLLLSIPLYSMPCDAQERHEHDHLQRHKAPSDKRESDVCR